MLHFVKGQSNTFIVTLQEKTTLVDPVYLFSFYHIFTKKRTAFILGDLSDYANHYNKFTFTEGSTDAKTLEEGQHDYVVYAQESTTNVDPDLALEEVERGILNVSYTRATVPEFENNETYEQHVS